jgi:hypothetical protein
MTLAPLVTPEIRGVEGKPGDVAGECVAPGCHSPAQQRHHLWPKSYLRGQPFEWVRVEGKTMANSVGLCVACHAAVTGEVGGHRAHIRYNPEISIFEWWAKSSIPGDGWFYVGPIDKQRFVDAKPEARRIRAQEGLCPECGKPLRSHAEQHPPGPKRKVTTWSVVVPDDGEVGSDVMDEWVEQFAALLGFGAASQRLQRYHVLALVLAWAAMNQQKFLEDLEEAEFWAGSSVRESVSATR